MCNFSVSCERNKPQSNSYRSQPRRGVHPPVQREARYNIEIAETIMNAKRNPVLFPPLVHRPESQRQSKYSISECAR